MKKILMPYRKSGMSLKNHLVMAPMTRSRAIDNIPTKLMAEYYSQRTGAGLIITEGTAPTPEGLGYPRIPGIFSKAQIAGWKDVTDAVHRGNSKIFLQLMHTGRIGHKDNLPEGVALEGASDIKASGKIFTDTGGLQEFSQPVALTTQGVKKVISGHVTAARNAIEAGFDGIELHGANGYLIEQFLNPNVNNRTDQYGGNTENRARLAIEMAKQISDAIGKEKVGIRVSPYSLNGDLAVYAQTDVHETYRFLASELDNLAIAYMHISVSPGNKEETVRVIRALFEGTIILCNGLTPDTAEAALNNGIADIVAFGKGFLANPDLDKRIAENLTLKAADHTTFFTVGSKGYTDY